MRKVTRYYLFSFFFLLFLWFTPHSNACNLTDLSLISIASGPGASSTITLRLCLGYGVTGSTKGADGATQSITFGWYTTVTSPVFAISSYTPTSITSTVTSPNCTMTSQNISGPGGVYAGSKIGTFFLMPGGCTNRFLCVSATPECSDVGQLCWNFSFVVNYVPDSVRLFGAEGAGNGAAGCYPNSDMKLNFTLLPVLWGDVEARGTRNSVNVSWTTVQENNSDVFYVERLSAQGDFEAIATVPASYNTTSVTQYKFTDLSPLVGTNTYRIVEVSKSGASDASKSTETTFQGSTSLCWGAIGPVPTHDFVKLHFFSPNAEKNISMQVVDVGGRVVMGKSINASSGANMIDLDLSSTNTGVYFVNLKSKTKSLFYKLVKA